MADSPSDGEEMEVEETSTLPNANGITTKEAASSESTDKPLKTPSDLKESDVAENCDSSNHANDTSLDEETSIHNSPKDNTSNKTDKNITETVSDKISNSESDKLEIDAETAESVPESQSKNLDTINDSSKDKSDLPTDADSPSSKIQSGKDAEISSVKSNSIPDRIFDNSPKCSPELIIGNEGTNVLLDRSKCVTSDTTPAAEAKTNGENGISENSTKTANDASENIVSEESSKAKEDSEAKEKKETKSEGKKEGESGKKKKGKKCIECGLKKKLPFRIVYQGKCHQMCSEACYKGFKQKTQNENATPSPAKTVVSEEKCTNEKPAEEKCAQCEKSIKSGQGFYPVVGAIKSLCSEECMKKYHDNNGLPKNCSQCKNKIESAYTQLTWETMMFCNEECLGKYQSHLGSHCTSCQTPVVQSSLGKYCVCFGADIRQFCSATCLDDFKKGLKVCSYCQTDLSAGIDGFLAPVGDKGQFKDFCSQKCMERYEVLTSAKTAPDSPECSHCKKQGSFKTHVKHEDKTYYLCCDLCVAGFRHSNNIQANVCNTCFDFFKPNVNENFTFQHEGVPKYFCTKACMTLYMLTHRKITPCCHCRVKKYTFDMIEKIDPSNHTLMYCSLNCLSLYRGNTYPSSKIIRCDNCGKTCPIQYHLTMSDGSMRNFCTYQCVIYFQNQFTSVPALTTSTATRQLNIASKPVGVKTTSTGTSPVMVSAISLANHSRPTLTMAGKGLIPQTLVTVRQQGSPGVTILSSKPQVTASISTAPVISVANTSAAASSQVTREIVVRPPVPKSVKNKSASCRPIMQTKGVNARYHTCNKAVQTDERPMPLILPVPIPIYVPTPMHLFSRPVTCPVPFPLPIPVPIIVHSNKSKDSQETTSTQSSKEKLLKSDEIVFEHITKAPEGSKDSFSTPAKKKAKTTTKESDVSQSEKSIGNEWGKKDNDIDSSPEITILNNTEANSVKKAAPVIKVVDSSTPNIAKSDKTRKRKAESEIPTELKKSKSEVLPVSGIDASNNDLKEVDLSDNEENNIDDEPIMLSNVT